MADMNESMEVTETAVAVPAKEEPKKSEKSPKKDKKPNAFVRFFKRIGKFFRDIMSEMKKVVWMPGKDVRKNSVLVVVSVIVFAAVIFVVDIAGGALVELLAKLIK